MRQNLTHLAIDKLKHPESGDVKVWDTVVLGFGVRVTSRRKSFFVVKGANRKLTTLGKYPDLSLQDARKAAMRILASDDEPVDQTPLRDVIHTYLVDCRERLRPRTVLEYRRHLEEAPDILLGELKRTSVALDAHRTASWKAFGSWCVKRELLSKNPFQHIEAKNGVRSRVLTDDELATIWRYDHEPFATFLKLCILTGQRRNEITSILPEWVQGDTITIPADVAKNGREHSIPFNLLTARYLQQHRRFIGFSKAKARFDRLHPLAHWTLHDLRRTFATIHARIGTPIHVVEAMLNHRSGTISGVAAIYIRHDFMREARAAALQYELFIAKLVGA